MWIYDAASFTARAIVLFSYKDSSDAIGQLKIFFEDCRNKSPLMKPLSFVESVGFAPVSLDITYFDERLVLSLPRFYDCRLPVILERIDFSNMEPRTSKISRGSGWNSDLVRRISADGGYFYLSQSMGVNPLRGDVESITDPVSLSMALRNDPDCYSGKVSSSGPWKGRPLTRNYSGGTMHDEGSFRVLKVRGKTTMRDR